MTPASKITAALALTALLSTASNAETMVKKGKTSSGDNCTVTVEKHADGSISAAGASAGGSSAGTVSSSSSAGGTGVHVQAGGGCAARFPPYTPGSGVGPARRTTLDGSTISPASTHNDND